MSIEHVWGHATGTSLDDLSVLGYRYDSQWGMQHTEMDSHVLLTEPGVLRAPLLTAGWLTGTWRSPTTQVTFVTDARSAVHRVHAKLRDDGTFVESEDFPASMHGVWGLDDEHVYAWGDASPTDHVMFRWDGKRWQDMACPGPVYGLHGVAPDLIFAVGERGLIARWNGHRWQRLPSGTSACLASVFVASPDEAYACAVSGMVLEGSVHGWMVVQRDPQTPCYSVAKFGDRVLLACGYAGIVELIGNTLEPFAAKILGEKLEARERLIISAREMIYVTPDLQHWDGLPIEELEPLVKDRPPAWVTHPL